MFDEQVTSVDALSGLSVADTMAVGAADKACVSLGCRMPHETDSIYCFDCNGAIDGDEIDFWQGAL